MPIEKDPRYKVAKETFTSGKAKRFADLFEVLKKSVLADDLNLHNNKITRMIDYPEQFPMTELIRVCDQMELDPRAFINMVLDHYLSNRTINK
jgi:hypothetical protein